MRSPIATALLLGALSCTSARSELEMEESALSTCPEGTIEEAGGCRSFLSLGCVLPPLPSSGDVELVVDQVYTTPYRGQSWAAPQALDVARPRVASGAPVALFVHGGGWAGGGKADHREDILRLTGHGWVALSVDYRLVQERWKNRFPAAITDVRCAVRWVRAHATELGADPTRILALGDSAGGQLVELLGTAPEESALDDGQCEITGDASVRGVVAYYGRADLTVSPIPDYLVDYIGRDGDWMTRERLGSPIRHVDSSTVPMLLVHGRDDNTVPIDQSRAMRDALRARNVTVGLMELPGQGHGFPMLGTSGTQSWGACSTVAFLDTMALARPAQPSVH